MANSQQLLFWFYHAALWYSIAVAIKAGYWFTLVEQTWASFHTLATVSRCLDPHLTCAIVRKNAPDMSLLNMVTSLISDANSLRAVVRVEIFVVVVNVSKKLMTEKWWGQCEGFLRWPTYASGAPHEANLWKGYVSLCNLG